MGKALWIPPNSEADRDREVFVCLVCGDELREENYAKHVPACARKNEDAIHAVQEARRPRAIFGSFDEEFRAWQRRTGKLW